MSSPSLVCPACGLPDAAAGGEVFEICECWRDVVSPRHAGRRGRNRSRQGCANCPALRWGARPLKASASSSAGVIGLPMWSAS